jgi:RNA polymerase sigma-70 factor (ECF subfamily)
MAIEKEIWAKKSSQLLAKARDGNVEALGELMELFRSYLLTIAQDELAAVVQPKAGASDIVQDTFLEAQRLFSRFQGEQGDEFRAWLRAILHNKLSELHNHYFAVQKRNVGREQSLDQSGDSGPLRDVVPGSMSTPSGHAVRNEENQALMAALNRLPEMARQTIVWRNWEGLSFAEIGRRLGRSEDAARMYFGRAVEQLAVEMERDHERRPDTAG